MADSTSSGVVIVGGGIVGVVTAYYLARAGVASVVVERDAIGSHASGFAYGGRRTVPDGGYYWRVTQFLWPTYAFIPVT